MHIGDKFEREVEYLDIDAPVQAELVEEAPGPVTAPADEREPVAVKS